MHIVYDRGRKIAGLSLLPISRSGPEQWFDNYRIVSLEDWDVVGYKSRVYPITDRLDPLPYFRLKHLIESPRCLELLTGELKDFDILIARPSNVPKELNSRHLLMLSTDLAGQFENKAKMREYFKDKLSFPDYKIYDLVKLNAEKHWLDEVISGREAIVIQADVSSSGKGTFLVKSLGSFREALKCLKEMDVKRVVISDYVEDADELSIQVCVTKQGIILGPLQRQVINNEALCNPELPATEKFCGGVIDEADQKTHISEEIREIAQSVGQTLKKEGYCGLFGIDFLFSKAKGLYLNEINARPTGLTPLLTSLDLPLLLLHILELGKYEYNIEDKILKLSDSGGLFMLHSKVNERKKLRSTPVSGTFTVDQNELKRISNSLDFSKLKPGEFILQNYYTKGTVILPGGRLARLLFKGKTMDKNKKVLYNEVQQTISIVEKHIILN